jgi:hypothetical protein
LRGKIIVNREGYFSVNIFLLLLLLLFFLCHNLYAGGNSEESETEILHDTWTLSVTQFDVSSLPPEKQIIRNIVTRKIVDQLSSLSIRVRPPEEIAYYTEYSWSQARLTSGQTLKSKRDERDALLFKGDTSWTYKNKIKKIDEEIKALEETYNITEAEFPLVAEHPVFSLTEQNLLETYPEIPEDGMEYSFCKEQKIDGFLSGTISEYYGRILVSIKLYTLYTRSYAYEESVLFSVEDQQTVLSELFTRLRSVLSGIEPSAIIVNAKPEDAIILVNEVYTGRGSSGEKTQDPGPMNIEIFAEDYRKENFQVDLFSGELAEVFINLQPIAYEAFDIDTSNGLGASVYLGSTFMGETPLTLNLLPDQYEYITMENEIGETTSFIYEGSISSAAVTLVLEEEKGKTVDEYRKSMYGAYGRFWISLPVTVLLYGVATSTIDASNYSGNIDMYNSAVVNRNISIGSIALTGAFLIESLIRMGIYLYKSNSTDVGKL